MPARDHLECLAVLPILIAALAFLCVAWVVVKGLAAGDWAIGMVVAPGDRP